MTGIDTTWLVDLEVEESPRHEGALAIFEAWRMEKAAPLLAFTHVFLEFQHIVTDPRRFERPLPMALALERIWFWADLDRVRIVHSTDASFRRAQLWLSAYKLGRDRIIDTHMAAAYAEAGVDKILTANREDFAVFNAFDLPNY